MGIPDSRSQASAAPGNRGFSSTYSAIRVASSFTTIASPRSCLLHALCPECRQDLPPGQYHGSLRIVPTARWTAPELAHRDGGCLTIIALPRPRLRGQLRGDAEVGEGGGDFAGEALEHGE